ncbi:Nucleotidylyl transferase [Melanomma pulvis-pyrius CBS 109.77]|uniref:arginine--tRNA ligase n=1 Tax=Melanomma pulvis-pyrius CBS 109.77 TaxID=1314802 RepID=A0A6A6X653_9PLEO|nr:Nucleotidylyl transferase [Melanomma pulvis-pyrius CBS 109.77]
MATLTVSELETSLEKLDLNVPIPHFASADVLNKPLDLVRSYLADILSSLVEVDRTAAYNSISVSNDPLHGDFTVVLPKLCPGAKAGDLAKDLIKKFPQGSLFGLPWEDGVHLRICVTPQTVPRVLVPYINDRKGEYGSDLALGLRDPSLPTGGRQKLVVEFSSPNIASEFQGKHLRSTIIGSFVSSLHENMGWDVTRLNYFGDWGKDMALLGVGWEKFGSEEAFQEDPTTHLLEVYHKIQELFLPEQVASKKARDEAKKKAQDEVEGTAEIESKGVFAERNEFFKRMENGDENALALYKRIRDVNTDNYAKLYARMGITFDEYSGESKVSQETMVEIEQLLKDKGICEESGGAWIIKLGARSGTAVIRDRSGSSTYLLRYLAAVLERSRKFEFDKMIFVAADRNGHFSKMFKIFDALDMTELRGKLQHVQFGDVSHMSDKLGHGHQPHEILNQCEKAMMDVLKADGIRAGLVGNSEDTAKVLGISGLLTQELSTKKTGDHAFDIDGMTSFKPGTGPDLQYWYARLCSILKAHPITEDLLHEEYGSLDDEEQTSLLLVLGQYPDITHAAFKSLESTPITAYLANVIEHLSDILDEHNAAEAGITPAQAALYEATRTVLENGMKLLGLIPIALQQQDRADTPVAE